MSPEEESGHHWSQQASSSGCHKFVQKVVAMHPIAAEIFQSAGLKWSTNRKTNIGIPSHACSLDNIKVVIYRNYPLTKTSLYIQYTHVFVQSSKVEHVTLFITKRTSTKGKSIHTVHYMWWVCCASYHPLSHVCVELVSSHLEIDYMVSREPHPISQLFILGTCVCSRTVVKEGSFIMIWSQECVGGVGMYARGRVTGLDTMYINESVMGTAWLCGCKKTSIICSASLRRWLIRCACMCVRKRNGRSKVDTDAEISIYPSVPRSLQIHPEQSEC